MAKRTPMMEQYIKIKENYTDAFLFFRLGDFYEMFYEDAIEAARELEITLTKRDSTIPRCGVPYHSAEGHIKNLIEKGYKVAICEQVEDPKTAKGVVKREVVQLITHGTVMESNMLSDHENNYLATIAHVGDQTFTVCYTDLSTGENQVAMVTHGFEAVLHELYNRPIKEIVVSSKLKESIRTQLQHRLNVTLSYQDEVEIDNMYTHLIEDLTDGRLIESFGRLLNYIQKTQKRSLDHLKKAETIPLNQYLSLD